MRYGRRRYGYSFTAKGQTRAVAPANTALPVITQTGSVLSVTTGTWTGTGPITYSYQWSRNGTSISGETAATYSIPPEDLNALFGCIVTATNAAGNASATAALLYVGLLDVLSVQSAASFTLRRLRRDQGANLNRVRRSSDQVETNIGFATVAQTRTNLDPVPAADGDSRTSAGITRTVVGTGTEFGQSYIDIRWNGTATATVNLRYCNTILTASPNATTNVLVTPGQTYTSSMGYRLVAGTFPAVTARLTQFYRNGTALVGEANNSLPTAPNATLQRCAVIGVAPATANYVQNILQMDGANGIVVDFTMRFYAPNTELGTGNARPLLQRYVTETIAAVGDLDANALLNFVGSASAFISCWYDQSGNSRDATQATPASQPMIVNAGALITENFKPTVMFNGSTNVTSVSAFSAAQFIAVQAWKGAVPFSSNYNGLTGFLGASSLTYLQPGSLTNFGTVLNGAIRINGANTPVAASALKVTSAQGTNAFTGAYSLGQGDLGGPRQWTGPISEAYYLNPAMPASDIAIIERNIGAYFGITVA